MKVVYNKWVPFKGFFAINLFGTMFVREEYKDREIAQEIITHETIHSEQMLDFVFGCESLKILGGIIFYIIYFIEWLIKCIFCAFCNKNPYRSLSFEQEAYDNDQDETYLENRKRFSWIKYLLKL